MERRDLPAPLIGRENFKRGVEFAFSPRQEEDKG